MGFDAFISYRRSTGGALAQLIREQLERKGIKCFLDVRDHHPGDFNKTILNAIEEAPFFLLLLTPGALDRCQDQEDYVRREIMAALRCGNKTIIPIMDPGFSWPGDDCVDIPEEIRNLKNHQAVIVSQVYMDAMIQALLDDMKDVVPKDWESAVITRVSVSSASLLASRIKNDPEVESVSMAFHAGAAWRRDSDKLDLLKQIVDRNIRLRILVNSGEAAEAMCSHMKQPMKRYTPIGDSARDWQELAKEYPDAMEVRITETPIMHRIYMVQGRGGSGMIDVKYYTYGNFRPDKDFRLVFEADMPEFRIYQEEFEYLWKNAAGCGTP